jgi:hypothetical protein
VATSFVTVESRVRELLVEFPDMPASVLAERVGWVGSESWFRENVRRIRPDYRRIDPADRLSWAPGDAAQCDLWFPPCRVPLEDGSTRRLPVLVITLAHSRFMFARMIPTRATPDLLCGTWELLKELGHVPRRLIWDNEGGIGQRRRLAAGVGSFMGTLATTLVQLPPRDPESKGIVERRNGFFETSFVPGRTFTSPGDFNAQFASWLVKANARVVRTLKATPTSLLESDTAQMLELPPTPLHLGFHSRVKLPRDYYVRVDTNDYSVDPRVIGRLVDVSADLERVRVRVGGRLVAEHARRWVQRTTVSDPAHVQVAAGLRRAFQAPVIEARGDDLTRDLADYDRAFGLAGEL